MPPITRNNKRNRPPTPQSSDDEEETALSNSSDNNDGSTSNDDSKEEEEEHVSIDLTKESEGSSDEKDESEGSSDEKEESDEYEDDSLEDFVGNLPDTPPPRPPGLPGFGNSIIIIPIDQLLRSGFNFGGGNEEEDDDFTGETSGDSEEDELSEDHYEKNPECGVDGPCDICKYLDQKKKKTHKRRREGNSPDDQKKKKRKKQPPIVKTKVDIKEEITTLDELLDIIDKYEDKPELDYSINIKYLKALKDPLQELKQVVGMVEIKQQIVDQVLFLLSHLQDDDQMLHTVIYGPPGAGKTLLGQILGKVYAALGYSNGKFKIAKASDLIAGYIGQTAIKTQKVIDEAKGGVLFIDEAYALGSRDDRDGFSKEAIDQLNQNLTERRTEFICIIAGYKEQLEKCFFAYNPGLNRRFPFRYEIKTYGMEELYAIFHSRLVQSGWTVDDIPISLFRRHEKYLTEKGGDMEIISQMTKLAYSRRTFGKHQNPQRHLILEDVEAGFELFLKNDEVKNRPKQMSHDDFFKNTIQPIMYS